MQIDFVYDESVENAPRGFQNALNEAASVVSSVILDNVTFTIAIGYGEVGGTPITGNMLAQAISNSGALVDYATLVNDLGMQSFLSADDRTFLGSLPATDPSNGGTWYLPIGQEKALGLVDPTTTEVDGVLGVSANFSYDFYQADGIDPGTFDLVGLLEHEMTHAMGRVAPPGFLTPLDLATYNPATGAPDLVNGAADRYFSIDGGATSLAGVNGPSDSADLSGLDGNGNPIDDPFNAILSPSTLYSWSSLDTTMMDVLGFTTEVAQDQATPPTAQTLADQAGIDPASLTLQPDDFPLGDGTSPVGGDGTDSVEPRWAANGVIDCTHVPTLIAGEHVCARETAPG